MSELVLLANLTASLYMTGVIALVQYVHYPLFARIHPDEFAAYHADHTRTITPVVAAPMVVELVSSVWLVISPPVGAASGPLWLGLAATMVSWIVTAIVSVPLHDRLSRGFDRVAHRKLLRSNWIRTGAWVAHSATLLWVVDSMIRR